MNNEVVSYFTCFYALIYPPAPLYFFTYLSSTWISGWNSGAHSEIPSKVRALPRFRESRPRHLGSRGQRQRRAFSTFVTFYPKNRPTTYSRSCTSKIHYLYLCHPNPPSPHSTTAVTVGLEWGWNTTVSPHHHATTCSQSLLCRLSLSLETVATKIASNPGIAGDAPYFNCNRLNINNAVTSSILERKQIVYLILRC